MAIDPAPTHRRSDSLTTSLPVRRALAVAVTTAALTGGLAVAGSRILDVPLRDPDGFLGPSWVRMPLIIAIALAVDVVPRALFRAVVPSRGPRGPVAALRTTWAERWPWARLLPVLLAVASFYVSYVGYRNLKNFLPFVNEHPDDFALVDVDRVLTFGHNPADLLHAVLGTDYAAHVLSTVYLAFLIFIPVSVGVSLIWSRHLTHGLWYVTALCVNWALGAASYYLVPSSGPFWALPWDFNGLAHTDVTSLQQALLHNRVSVLSDPHATSSVSGIAAFASLHVSCIFTAALVVQLTSRHAIFRWVMWVYFAATVTSTIYFGWHYLSDDIAGVAIGLAAVWLGAWATGHTRGGDAAVGVTDVDHSTDAPVTAAHGATALR